MKHLKLFEDTQKTFWAIDEDEWENGVQNALNSGNKVRFDEYDLSSIKKVKNSAVIEELTFGNNRIDIADERIQIYKSPDEWYWVDIAIHEEEYGGTFFDNYKCDQIDGVLDCLRFLDQQKEDLIKNIMKYVAGSEEKMRKCDQFTLVEIESILQTRIELGGWK